MLIPTAVAAAEIMTSRCWLTIMSLQNTRNWGAT